MEEIKKIIINEQEFSYIGLPLSAFSFNGHCWGGYSNFLKIKQKEPNMDVKDLTDCFRYMNKDAKYEDYLYGYILDYTTRTIYYDKEEALSHLLEKQFPSKKTEGFFVNFIQKNFKEDIQ